MTSPAVEAISGLSRFQSLWRRCLIEGAADASAAIHQRLVSGYNEPQRHYHTLAHIDHCLSMFDQCKLLATNPDALEIAVWFHDVIFEPGKRDNEALSAELYEELSAGVHAGEFRELVGRLIMATLHNERSLDDSDAGYMVDIDLSSFGLPWEDFLRDSRHLREESAQLSDADYHRKQGEFRSCLLARSRFYQTDFFCQRYERQARDNLAKYFDQPSEAAETK
jgi:predicted metal-dependent HD superfamily phosphohydrolase